MTPIAAIQAALNKIIEGIASYIEGSSFIPNSVAEGIRRLKVEQTGSLQTTKDMRVKPTDLGKELAEQAGITDAGGGEFGGAPQIVGKVGDDVTIGSSSTTMTPDALAATDPNTFGSGTSD
jgi:hypothetical protein